MPVCVPESSRSGSALCLHFITKWTCQQSEALLRQKCWLMYRWWYLNGVQNIHVCQKQKAKLYITDLKFRVYVNATKMVNSTGGLFAAFWNSLSATTNTAESPVCVCCQLLPGEGRIKNIRGNIISGPCPGWRLFTSRLEIGEDNLLQTDVWS